MILRRESCFVQRKTNIILPSVSVAQGGYYQCGPVFERGSTHGQIRQRAVSVAHNSVAHNPFVSRVKNTLHVEGFPE